MMWHFEVLSTSLFITHPSSKGFSQSDTFSIEENIFRSWARNDLVVLGPLTNRRNRSGPKFESCGTPDVARYSRN